MDVIDFVIRQGGGVRRGCQRQHGKRFGPEYCGYPLQFTKLAGHRAVRQRQPDRQPLRRLGQEARLAVDDPGDTIDGTGKCGGPHITAERNTMPPQSPSARNTTQAGFLGASH
jgi:hypothetical protein